eukprot:3718156-Prymnesium_polylepis.1
MKCALVLLAALTAPVAAAFQPPRVVPRVHRPPVVTLRPHAAATIHAGARLRAAPPRAVASAPERDEEEKPLDAGSLGRYLFAV